ncbi:hypothetical protein [Limnothrix redekei]|uniref:vWA-MoxR associated protein N-terminal HTH domain-containing protein n=1 Tax=Limnothrix redekei LRLZ20PSL1 TaxID=3112953 RepID=A0ABW7CAX1_9CYAN
MDIQKVLCFLDDLILDRTGQHLDDVQLGVIEGVLKRQKYSEIAQALNCTEGYAKDTGYELWKILSDIFQEEVSKNNLKTVLLRKGMIYNSIINIGDNNTAGSVHACGEEDESQDFQRGQKIAKLEAVKRLRSMGLTDQQISIALDLPIADVQGVPSTQK